MTTRTVITLLIQTALFAGMWALVWSDYSKNRRLYRAGAHRDADARLKYGVVVLLLGVGCALALTLIYSENTITHNLKRLCALNLLWGCAYTDFKTYRIPNRFLIAACIARVALLIAEALSVDGGELLEILASTAIAAAATAGTALVCAFAVKNALGFGDVKLLAVMALFLEGGILAAAAVSLTISFAVALYCLISKKKKGKDVIPFAPSLLIGTFLSVTLTGM